MNRVSTERGHPVAPWMRFFTRQAQFVMDLAVLAIAFFLAYSIRFEFDLQWWWLDVAITQLPWVVLLQFAAFLFAGVYAFVWKYVGLSELRAFILPISCSALLLVPR